MRKITSFLMMVLFSVVAFAQGSVKPITSLDELSNEGVYTIKSKRCVLLFNPNFTGSLATTNGKAWTGTAGLDGYDPANTNMHFRIEQKDGSYYLFSVGANKYVAMGEGNLSRFVDEPTQALTITESGDAEYPWMLKFADNQIFNSQDPGQTDAGIMIDSWSTKDNGNVYEIAEIDVTNVDPFEAPYNALSTTYDRISGSIDVDDLREGKNVGTSYANYKEDIAAYFIKKTEAVEDVIAGYATQDGLAYVKTQFATTEDLNKFTAEYSHAYDSLINNTIARAMVEIANGYYVINSAVPFLVTKSDTIFHTQESADAYNEEWFLEPGVEGYVEAGDVADVISTDIPSTKAVYAANANAKWADVKEEAAYLFWIERSKNDSVPTYHIINQYDKKSLKPIIQSTNATFELCDTAEFVIDWYGVKTLESGEVPQIAIRSLIPGDLRANHLKDGYTTEKSFNYMHLGGHGYNENTQKGNASGNIVGWSGGALVSQFYLTPVDEATVQAWMAKLPSQKEIRAKVDFADSIAAAFPAQLEIAKDEYNEVVDSMVTDASQYSSPYTETREGSIDALNDNNPDTYWHSDWTNSVDSLVHYLQIEAAEPLEGTWAVKMSRRKSQSDHITSMAVYGYNENNPELTVENGTRLGTLTFGSATSGAKVVSNETFEASGFKVFRFYSLTTTNNRGFWHAAEFNVVKTVVKTHAATTQYTVRKDIADALSAAVEAWDEAAYNRDSTSLLANKTFVANYNAIVAAGEAWGAVYVNPAALRNAIDAAPTNLEALFPIGTNPGEWTKENFGKINIATVVSKAKTYNESGAYTPAESEAHVKAIADSEANALASANKVQTGVWYRFAFPAESLYDTFGWDKTGSKAVKSRIQETADSVEVSRSLWNKYAASGYSTSIYEHASKDGVKDTIRQYIPVVEVEAYREDMNIFFFTQEELDAVEGGSQDAQLFRFIQATDSTYMIQHKGSGLFLQGAWPCVLSAKPTFFDVNALGAGTNLIGWTDVLGNRQNSYLHGQRSDGALVTWNATTLGSNSMMRIEATSVPVVEEEIPAQFTKWMWPGRVYANTYPVDVKVVAGDEMKEWDLVAYGADLLVTETDTTISLRPVAKGVTIKAGTPFFLVCNTALVGDAENYESVDSATVRIKAEFAKENEGREFVDVSEDNNYLNSALEGMYGWVTLEHGAKVDTLVHQLGNALVGTFKQVAVKPYQGFVASENGFKFVTAQTNVAANSAYIKAEFGEDVKAVSNITISLNGASIESAINEVMNKVVKNGNIYNAAGQLVGKGNINTINSLPAGVYIVNGVKVTKN